MSRLWLAGLVVWVGCASAPIRKQDQAALAGADALVLQGCYDCLVEARAIYERVAVGRARPLVVQRLFETELLIVLREKELALDWREALGRARALVPSLSPAIGPERYLELVEAIPPDADGWPRREMPPRPRPAFITDLDSQFLWLETGALSAPVRQYVGLALNCVYPPRRPAPGQPPTRSAGLLQVAPDAPPLVRYRGAFCRTVDAAPLEQVRAQVPRFVETSYFLARLVVAVAQKNGPGKGRELLTEVHTRFPQSPSVTHLYGRFNQLIGDLLHWLLRLAIKDELDRSCCVGLTATADPPICPLRHADASRNCRICSATRRYSCAIGEVGAKSASVIPCAGASAAATARRIGGK